MKEGLTKKAGPLPVWGWILLAGGGLGLVLLYKKGKAAKATEGAEPIPEHLSIPGVEGGAGSGGGAGEAKSPLGEAPRNESSPSSVTGTPVSEFLQTEHELEAGGWERHQAAAAAAAQTPSGSSAGATHNQRSAVHGGTPGRGGALFRVGTYKGMAAHIYARAVPGGVGKGKNVIVLGGPRGNAGSTHAKKGDHSHAGAKGHTGSHTGSTYKAPEKGHAGASRARVDIPATGGTSAPPAARRKRKPASRRRR